MEEDGFPQIVLPPEIFLTVPGTARVHFIYFSSSRLFRARPDTWDGECDCKFGDMAKGVYILVTLTSKDDVNCNFFLC